MPQVQTSQGPIEYADTGGDGPVVVLFGGLAIGPSLWDGVVAELAGSHRCIVLTLPWGAHRLPMDADADLSLAGHARIVCEAVQALGPGDDVTLVENDTGMLQLIAADAPPWLGRIVITSCEAFENYPPGVPGKAIGLLGRLPGGVFAALSQLRIRPLRRTPVTFGWMTKRPIPHAMFDAWLQPALSDRLIRRDLTKYIRSVDRHALLRNAEGLRSFDRPALVAWAADDRVMPLAHGRRLAELLPQSRYEEVQDSRTLIPLDQPQALARLIASFVAQSGQPAPALTPNSSQAPSPRTAAPHPPSAAP